MEKLKIINPNIYYVRPGDCTIIELAIYYEDFKLIKILLDNGAIPEAGNNFLHFALLKSNNLVQIFLILNGITWKSLNSIESFKQYYLIKNPKTTPEDFDRIVNEVRVIIESM